MDMLSWKKFKFDDVCNGNIAAVAVAEAYYNIHVDVFIGKRFILQCNKCCEITFAS